jgi:hypothetical protein
MNHKWKQLILVVNFLLGLRVNEVPNKSFILDSYIGSAVLLSHLSCISFYRLSSKNISTVYLVNITVVHGMAHRVGRVLSFFSSRRNWDSPNPSPIGECAPPPFFWGWGTLAGETGVGRVPIPTRGHTLWYVL